MVAIFTLTAFSSAFLLFLIQPMASKMLLPFLGGAPAVWNTAMMFFQAVLLAGYAYAHLTTRWLRPLHQATVHLVLAATALLLLPVEVGGDLSFAASEQPIRWLLSALALSVGFPFFLLAANAPMIQHWLAGTSHRDAEDPYFLYAASNLGSMLALLSYPFLVEPLLPLGVQAGFWSAGYVAFFVLIVVCAYLRRMHAASPSASTRVPTDRALDATVAAPPPAEPSWRERILWVLLAFVPSSLMLGVTVYITTDIASLPLLWIAPLSLYLLTFILAFARVPRMIQPALNAQIVLVPVVAVMIAFELGYLDPALLGLHLLAFFAIAMGCHGRLALSRPSARHLTEFYFFVSLGGVLGGTFNAVIAPVLFTTPMEYPLVLVAGLLLRPARDDSSRGSVDRAMDFLYPLGLLVLVLGAAALQDQLTSQRPDWVAAINGWLRARSIPSMGIRTSMLSMLLGVALLLVTLYGAGKFHRRPIRFGLLIAAVLCAIPLAGKDRSSLLRENQIFVERNFFGVSRVLYSSQANVRVIMHGSTLHGVQSQDPRRRLQPGAYYGPLGPLFELLPESIASRPVAILGLGTGSLACFGRAGQPFDFYELDPLMVRLATDPEYFTFLRDCPAESNVILGDGRLMLEKAEPGSYGVVVLDMYSSDAIPVHTLTREALEIYLDKRSKDGMLLFNISNRHLDLSLVLAALAEDLGQIALVRHFPRPRRLFPLPSIWAVLTENEELRATLERRDQGWQTLDTPGDEYSWTDNDSNLLQLLFKRGSSEPGR